MSTPEPTTAPAAQTAADPTPARAGAARPGNAARTVIIIVAIVVVLALAEIFGPVKLRIAPLAYWGYGSEPIITGFAPGPGRARYMITQGSTFTVGPLVFVHRTAHPHIQK